VSGPPTRSGVFTIGRPLIVTSVQPVMASKNSIAAERDETGRNLPHRSSVRIYSRYGSVKESAGTLTVTFEFSEELTLGLAHRAREARRRVLKWLRRVDPLTIEKGDAHLNATFSCHVAGALTSALNAIDRDLQALMRERLHPALVEELLGITGRERIRWTKDGRLPSFGRSSFSRGPHSIGYAFYRPSEIFKLANSPDVIRQWRAADAAKIHAKLTGP
jgi:hypothetical protein